MTKKISWASSLFAALAVSFLLVGCSSLPPKTSTTSSTPLSISGSVSSLAGAGATVTLSGPFGTTTTTDSRGNFSFKGLPSGVYAVTPTKTGFTFTPATLTTALDSNNVSGLDFAATKKVVEPKFSIGGLITPATNGAAATVTLTGPATATATSDSSGRFSFANLPAGTYHVTPSKNGFTFSPASQSTTVTAANIAGMNFTATQAITGGKRYGISGSITPASNGGGSIVTLSGAVNATTTADGSGNYSFSGLPSGTYSITPSKSAVNFSPGIQSVTLGANDLVGVNFSASPSSARTVNIYPGQDIPQIVSASPAGTTFIIYPGLYRLTSTILPKNGDRFIGQTACAPPSIPCPAIISGSTSIGSQATFDGHNFKVTDQPQHGARGGSNICDSGWAGCIYPEDLFFDGVPYKHLNSSTLPAIGSGQWWFDYAHHTIYFHDNPAGHVVETSVVTNGFGGSANYVTIQYLTIEKFADMYPAGAIGDSQGPNPLTQGAHWTVQNNEVRLNHGFGVRVGYAIQILNNYIHDNGEVGIGGGIGTTAAPSTESLNSNILIQNNVVNHNDFAHFDPGFGSGGFKVGSTSGITLRGNTFQYNEGAGIHFDVNSQNEFVDGNIITDNTDSDGLAQEIGFGTSTFRNNIVLRNGAHVNDNYYAYQIGVHASTGVHAYCNVMEIPAGAGINGWGVDAANRGYSDYPSYQYLMTTGNSFHHNTVIWDSGANGVVGFAQNDPTHQPNFFASNTRPDYNAYHLSSLSAAQFQYDDNDSRSNIRKSFASYQLTTADVHGTVDTNYASGFPRVSISSPTDQSTTGNQVTVSAAASDASGIRKVEFYVDWNLQATVTANPYTFTWNNVTSGTHTITATAYSNAGISSCYAISLTKP